MADGAGRLADMIESAGQQHTITASLAMALARRMEVADGTGHLADLTESTGQHNTIAA